MQVNQGEIQRRNRACGCCVLFRLLHWASKLFTEELHHESVDRVSKDQYAPTPQPAKVAIIFHADKIIHRWLVLLGLYGVATSLVFRNGQLHPLLRVGGGIEKGGLNVGAVEEYVPTHWIFCVAGNIGIEEFVRVRYPASILVVLWIDVKVARAAVRVLAVVNMRGGSLTMIQTVSASRNVGRRPSLPLTEGELTSSNLAPYVHNQVHYSKRTLKGKTESAERRRWSQ